MNDQYYKLPYAFFENEKYRGLTANEGYIYAVLYARYELSCKNNDFHDSDGTFVYYTVRGLMSYVGISSTATAVKCLKNLESLGLITRKKGRIGQPDKVYLHEVEPAKKKQRKIEYPDLDIIFPGLEGLVTSDEMKAIEGVINNLTAEKKDAYVINGKSISARNILNHIMLLGTGDIVNVIFKMRETYDIKNQFMYLMTALYNASV
ncbi:MAG: replication initiator protein A [Clostridia bacterium]|nr:replication initiator protein A [Clostridia bacterium]MBQ7522617.1 replication initiator protein A [Clostridia bacterium]